MTAFFYDTILDYSSLVIVSFTISFLTYFLISYSRSNFLSFLYLPAHKSPTNARLLGGLGFTSGLVSAILYLSFTHRPSIYMTPSDLRFLQFSLFPMSLLTISGYIDDRFEIRARYKLMFQLLAISSFALFTTREVSQNSPFLVFFASTALGILLVNGTNLLDGLDTMTVKLGIVVSLTFAYLGMKSESGAVIIISACTISILSAFYLFNREPARIYMGEIGGSVVGFLFFAQASLSYKNLIKYNNGYQSAAWIVIACSLPLCELGISFLRRVLMKKSPFRGDKLHLHHILKAKYKMTSSKTSTVMAVMYASFFVTGYLLGKYTNPLLGAFASTILITGFYVASCLNEWRATIRPQNFENVFLNFENKTVHVLNSDLLAGVQIQVKTSQKSRQDKRAA